MIYEIRINITHYKSIDNVTIIVKVRQMNFIIVKYYN